MKTLLYFATIALTLPAIAQPSGLPVERPVLKTTSDWLGNTFGGGDGRWVQNYTDEIEVAADGTLYTASQWDEAGRCTGAYKDGDVNTQLFKQFDGRGGHKAWGWGTGSHAIAVDESTLYLANTEGELLRFERAAYKYRDTTKLFEITEKDGKRSGGAVGMTHAKGVLYIVRDNGEIHVRRADDLSPLRTFSVPGARDMAVAPDGELWILTKNAVARYSPTGQSENVSLPDTGTPTALAFDNQGRLLVCDNGARQVLIYDVKTAPRLVGAFGEKGGITAGVPGQIAPHKLFSLAGAATDAAGHLYVALSRGMADGLVLRQFKPDGKGNWNAPGWEVSGVHFVDSVVPIPGTDGTQVYARSRRITLDFNAPLGKGWNAVGYTLPPDATGESDVRLKDPAYHPAFIRTLQGRQIIYMTPMMAGTMHFYRRAEGEFLRPFGVWDKRLGWGIFPDEKGDIWEAGGAKIRCTPFAGFDAEGRMQFGAPQEWDAPTPFSNLQRVVYWPQSDTLLLAGYTPDKKEETWGIVGKVMMSIPNWRKGNRTPQWTIDVPHDWKPQNGPKIIMKSMTIEGDYIFMGGVETRAQVWVFRLHDGAFVGVMNPDPKINLESTGWIDMVEAISATRRADGEYVIYLEEDYRNKIVVYRWKP